MALGPACDPWERSQEHEAGDQLSEESRPSGDRVPQPDITLMGQAHCSVPRVCE